MLECTNNEDLRKVYLPRDRFTRSNTLKFEDLTSSSDIMHSYIFKIAKCKIFQNCEDILRNFKEQLIIIALY